MFIIAVFVCCSVPLTAIAQDTIYTASSEKLLVKVLEISKDDISYKRYYNPDGIIYHIACSGVKKIIYENGREENRFIIEQKTTTQQAVLFSMEGKQILYQNRYISTMQAYKIMMKRDPHDNSEELNETLLLAEGKKTGQISFNIAAPVCAVGGLYLARRNYYNPNDAPKARAFVISGIGLCVTSIVVAQIFKAQKNKAIRKAALLYNKEL